MSFELFTNIVIYLKDEIDTLLSGKSATGHTHAHADTTGQTADQHHAKTHNHSGATEGGPLALPASAGTAVFSLDMTGGATLNIANDDIGYPTTNADNMSGLFLVQEGTTGILGLFLTGGGSTTLIGQAGGGLFTVTMDHANSVNVYSASGVLCIQNKWGSQITVLVMTIRTRTS